MLTQLITQIFQISDGGPVSFGRDRKRIGLGARIGIQQRNFRRKWVLRVACRSYIRFSPLSDVGSEQGGQLKPRLTVSR